MDHRDYVSTYRRDCSRINKDTDEEYLEALCQNIAIRRADWLPATTQTETSRMQVIHVTNVLITSAES